MGIKSSIVDQFNVLTYPDDMADIFTPIFRVIAKRPKDGELITDMTQGKNIIDAICQFV